jgi:hypothetical protein
LVISVVFSPFRLDEIGPVVPDQKVGIPLTLLGEPLAAEDETVSLWVLQLLHLVKGCQSVEGTGYHVMPALVVSVDWEARGVSIKTDEAIRTMAVETRIIPLSKEVE